MSGDDHAASSEPPLDGGQPESLHRRVMRALALLTPWGINRRIGNVESRLRTRFEARLDSVEARLDTVESRLDAIEEAIRAVQEELAATRNDRLGPLEERADAAEVSLRDLSSETIRLRDRVMPAAVERSDVLIDRLAEELEETGSLVERLLRREPLPVSTGSVDETMLAGALAEVQPRLLEAFRGSDEEVRHRLDRYLDDLKAAGPVLDLGCGRGELLLMLREAGVAATGVEGDPALVEGARRRGLRVVEGDVLDILRDQESESWGAVTAIHLLEHLGPSMLAQVVSEVRRVLQPGGLVLAECPNPHSLRVGASLFWLDPTHQRPLLPETLELFLESAGLEIECREMLHPFPAEQMLADDGHGERDGTDGDLADLSRRVDRLGIRLDELLNGPRDFAVRARRPVQVE